MCNVIVSMACSSHHRNNDIQQQEGEQEKKGATRGLATSSSPRASELLLPCSFLLLPSVSCLGCLPPQPQPPLRLCASCPQCDHRHRQNLGDRLGALLDLPRPFSSA